VKELLDAVPESLERKAAWGLANDRLGMTVPLRGTAPRPASSAAASSNRIADAGPRLEREALAGVVAHEELKPLLAELTEEHFHVEVHRTLRAHLVDGAPLDEEALALLAELDALAAHEGIEEAVGTELLLTLRERGLQEELQEADLARTRQIQEQILRLRHAQAEVRKRATLPD
jgi:hypothetical protein